MPKIIFARPLIDTLSLLPKERTSLQTQINYTITDVSQQESLILAYGLFSDLTLSLNFNYLHLQKYQINNIGDLNFKITKFLFQKWSKWGLTAELKFPLGVDIYKSNYNPDYGTGNYALKIALVSQKRFFQNWLLVVNCGYCFNYQSGENLFAGFKLNPFRFETYKSVFGLNPFYENSFLYYQNLKNDYLFFAAAIALQFSSIIFHGDLAYSQRITSLAESKYQPIEGEGYNPLRISLGVRWLINSTMATELAVIYSSDLKKYHYSSLLLDFILFF